MSKLLTEHRKQVQKNLWLFRPVEQVVGWDRFLLGLALCDLHDGVDWGSPLWPTQVDTWAEEATASPAPSTVEALKSDPRALPLDDIDDAIRAGLGFAHGRERWHQQHCGDPHHGLDPALRAFFGLLTASLMGLPEAWLYAALKQRD